MAANLVAAPAISAGFNVLFDNVVREFLNYVRCKGIVDPDVLSLKLRTTMLALSVVLNDAKEKHITNSAVLEWLEELAGVIYDAEDLEDDIQTQALHLKMKAEFQLSPLNHVTTADDQVSDIKPTTISEEILLLFEKYLKKISSSGDDSSQGPIIGKLRDICDKLDVFLPQVAVLGLEQSLKTDSNKTPIISYTNFINHGTSFIGRESEKEKMISFLMEPDQETRVHVVVIEGSVGVGKTTFAQMVYDDFKLKNVFNLKCWVSFPTEISAEMVIKEILEISAEMVIEEILESVTNKPAPTDDPELKLSKVLLGQNFLLILDDVGVVDLEQTFWDDLLRPLHVGPKGVTVVIITRDDRAALKNFHVDLVLQLNPLGDADCWSLLKEVVFGRHEVEIDKALEESGKQIAEKCNGSPLAARVLGGALRFTRDVEDWDSILRSKMWHLMAGPNTLLPALRLGYSYLPAHLKRCFSYCSIFPKKYKFEKERLVLLWIAEGFVQESGTEATLEEVGDSYFQELLSRSLFQQSSSIISHFWMHDAVHELAQHVSGNICFMLKKVNPLVCPSKSRHFSYVQIKHDNFEYFKVIDGLKHFDNLRTFLPFKPSSTNLCHLDEQSQSFFQSFFLKLTSLRVLSLSHYDLKEIPQSLSSLSHLRFLDLSRTSIEHLPLIFCNLYNLQTLLLQKCPFLIKLPEKLGNLVSLRHLDISGCNKLQEFPIEFNKLRKIHTLSNFVVGKASGAKLSSLAKFHIIRGHLTISGLQNVLSIFDASEANLKTKMHLDELTLEWRRQTHSTSIEEHVCRLLKPSKSLKKINISAYGGKKLADWIGDPAFCAIVSVTLSHCYECSCLPSLGQLPFLKNLHIVDFPKLDNIGPEFYTSDKSCISPFQALESLRLEKMLELKVWSSYEGDGELFPSLQELHVENCPKLSQHLPRNLPFLLKLEIIKCDELTGLLPELPSICRLKLQECEKLELMSISTLTTLVSLDIRGVSIIKSLASDLRALGSLRELNMVHIEDRMNSMMLCNDENREVVAGYTVLIGENIQDLSIKSCAFQMICPYSSLRSLNISHCKNLKLDMDCFSSLQSLDMSHCKYLESFPFEIFPMLTHLKIKECSKLEMLSLPQGTTLQHLFELSIISCPKLLYFPNQGFPAPNLASFSISDCKRLKWLPSQMKINFTSLQLLAFLWCPKLEPIAADDWPPKLQNLHIKSCPGLKDWLAYLPASVKRPELD